MLRSIHRLAKSRALVRRDGLTRASIARSYLTETSPESSSTSPEQEAIEEARMLQKVEEERMRSAAETERIKSAVEKAKLKRKAIEASTTKVPASKASIVKGVTIKRAAAKSIAAKGAPTRNIPTKSIPIKTTTKDVTWRGVITKDAIVKAATTKNTTIKAAVAKEPVAKEPIAKVVTKRDATTEVLIRKDDTTKDATTTKVTAKDTAATVDATTATNVRSSSPIKGDRPVGVARKHTTPRSSQQAPAWPKLPRKGSRKGKLSSKKPLSELPLLRELPEPEFQLDPPPAEEEATDEQLPRELFPKEKPLAEENYRRLGIEHLSEHDVKRKAWLKTMSKDERNEHVRKTYGWSVEIPYSRELYYNPENRERDPIIRKRFHALQQLRMIMGYSTTAEFKDEWLKEFAYRLRKTNMRDVRFICIDTDRVRRLPEVLEGEWKRRVTSFHLGVAILDTRDIRDVVMRSINLPNPADLIKTYEFAVQTEVPEQDNFIFGETQSISLDDLRKKFIEWQSDRTVVGVAYSARNDLIILKDFDIYLDHVYWLDLCLATYLITKTPKAPTLSGLLELLGIRYSKLHAAGNDAHFTLRALMGSAVLDVANELEYGGSFQPWCGLASSIAKAPLPLKEREELRERARQMAESKSARTNWHIKKRLSKIPLPYN